MKKYIFVTIYFFISTVVKADGILHLEKKSIDVMATIADEYVQLENINIKNTGNIPIFIHSLDVSCSCTSPSINKVFLNPGETGEITTRYRLGRKVGLNLQNIIIRASSLRGTRLDQIITIRVHVIKPFKIDPSVIQITSDTTNIVTISQNKDYPIDSIEVPSYDSCYNIFVVKENECFRIFIKPLNTYKKVHLIPIIVKNNLCLAKEYELPIVRKD